MACRDVRYATEPEARVKGLRQALLSKPHSNALIGHKLLRLCDGVLAKVKNAGREYRVGTTLDHAIGEVLQVTYSARGNDRNVHRISNRPGDREFKTVSGTVSVHTR